MEGMHVLGVPNGATMKIYILKDDKALEEFIPLLDPQKYFATVYHGTIVDMEGYSRVVWDEPTFPVNKQM